MNTTTAPTVSFEAMFRKGSVMETYREPPRARRIIVLPLARLATPPLGEGQCCDRAEIVSCVCRVSYRCGVHGTVCIGSHD